jgi:putative tryptophan/tyrosine transport system substrate-binding protein
MRRREFIAGLGSAAAVWPLAVRAQQPKIRHVGIIDDTPEWNPFRSRLRELGYVEGENIAFDYASGEGKPERLAEAAAQLVRRRVDVIACYGTVASYAAKLTRRGDTNVRKQHHARDVGLNPAQPGLGGIDRRAYLARR